MCEFRTVYSAPCSADRLCKPSYVYRCINIGVPLGSARTREAMPLSFSRVPANTTCLRRVCGINECDLYSDGFSFVFNEILKLSECPTMQASSDFYSSFDVCSNIRQVFHPNLTNAALRGFRDNGLTNNVIHMLDMSLFSPRDFVQFSFCCTTTVGLKPATMREMLISLMSEFPSSKYLSRACGGKIVFANINSHHLASNNWFSIGNIKEKIKIPNALPKYETSLFCFPTFKKHLLELPVKQFRLNSSAKRKKRNTQTLDGVSSFVEINGLAIKRNARKRLVFFNSAIAVQRLIGISDTMHSLANHLASKIRECFSNFVVNHVVQSNAIPASLFLGDGSDHVAGGGELSRQSLQCLGLLRGRGKFERNGSLHIGHSNPEWRSCKAKSTPFLPMPEGRGFLELPR